jgi:peptidyl-prolyl cis-trans isomerase SurA
MVQVRLVNARIFRWLLGLAPAAAVLCAVPTAHATIVERVVAVIGERPVLWTELLHRAASARVQIRMQTNDANVVSVQEQEMYKELLQRMIDDRLEEQQADKAHITVTPEEIDRAIANIAAQAQAQMGRPVTAREVMEEERRRGMTEQDFRDEIRRQILEGKLMELRVRQRVRVTEQDARAAYQHFVQEFRDQQAVDVRILVLRIPPGSTRQEEEAKVALADQIVKEARSGKDFCALVRQYTDDASTKTTCGSHGPQAFAQLLPPIQELVKAVKPGEVSDPRGINAGGAEKVVLIAMPMGAANVPAYEQVKNEMMQKAMLDGLERAKRQWLQELRQNVYIDVRL